MTDLEGIAEEFTPRASEWFSPTQEYTGRCVARFSAPRGSVEGQARVTVDEQGRVRVEMASERDSLQTEEPFTLGLIRFFGGEDFVQDLGNGISTINPFSQNPCEGLEVVTATGTFSTDDVLVYTTSSVLETGDVTSASFTVGESVFEASGAGEPRYWVLPLTNFLSECRQWRPELNRHPLRIFPTPEVPDEITHWEHGPDQERDEMRAATALLAANSKNKLITFAFRDGLGFVERLPDYWESQRLLLEGKEKVKITAVMVGPTGGGAVGTLEEMQGWFPFDVVALLTLATGTEIGRPWVEVRDGEGRLVRRFHRPLGVKSFREGRRLVWEMSMNRGGYKATGRLIECGISRSREFGETFLRIAIGHLVRAGYEDQSLDDSMTCLARGFETLCKRYGMTTQVLSKNLGPALRKDVKDILKDSAQRIRGLATGAAPGELAALERIASRVTSADQTDKPFGIAVAQLLKAFWLPDAQILEEHFRGRSPGWGAILSHYRGDVIHHGYLDILEAGHDWRELAVVRTHLYDALARVILKILRFDGGYNPWPTRYLESATVDWVKPQQPASTLGY